MARNESLLVEVGAAEENAQLRSPNLLFAPLNRTIRGRFSFHAAGPMAAREMIRWPSGEIPGQQIEIDAESETGAIIETLYEEAYTKFRKHIEQRGMVLPPEREEFKSIDAN